MEKIILQTGDLIFTYKNSILNRLIKYFSKKGIDKESIYNIAHVGLYIKENDSIFEADQDKIKMNKFKKYNKKKYILHYGRLKNAAINDYYIDKLNNEIKYFLNKKYSFLQLPVVMIKKLLRLKKIVDIEPDKYICSELICFLVYNVWKIKLSNDFSGCTPLDIYLSKELLHL